MTILSVVGARPEFIQAAPVSSALRARCRELLVHTGQHYDYQMSQLFFQETGIPRPDHYLNVGSGSHGRQTGEMLARLEDVLLQEKPEWVLVRGDTNSTLAGALAAAKLGIPVAHVEAGARSFDRTMPEEINRVVVDHLSSLLFCIAPSGVENLKAEGIVSGVHYVGDVMYDALLHHLPAALRGSDVLARLGLRPKDYLLATVHRAANTDRPANLRAILSALNSLEETLVFPIHPRTRKALEDQRIHLRPHILAIEPIGYLDMLALEHGARAIVTDSGGVTREAYFLGIPCITLRDETEHVETVQYGWNVLAGTSPRRIVEAVQGLRPPGPRPPIYGDGTAAQKIAEILSGFL